MSLYVGVRSPTSPRLDTPDVSLLQFHTTVTARFLFETGERSGERQSDGVVVEGVVVHPSPRSCSCSCSYARPLNINKGIVSLCPLSRRSVARQPLPLRQIKLALYWPQSRSQPHRPTHTEYCGTSLAARSIFSSSSSSSSVSRDSPFWFPSRQPFGHRFLLAWAVRAAYSSSAVFRKPVNGMERSSRIRYGPRIGKDQRWTKDGSRTPVD